MDPAPGKAAGSLATEEPRPQNRWSRRAGVGGRPGARLRLRPVPSTSLAVPLIAEVDAGEYRGE